MGISKELLDILACPKCKGDIHLNQNSDGLICDADVSHKGRYPGDVNR